MNIYFNNPHAIIDPSVIISIFALISSLIALYCQFFRKIKKLVLNIFPYDLDDFSNSSSVSRRDIAKNKISLSNSGNTSILLVSINYQTIDLDTISTYETNRFPSDFPILLKPGDTLLYSVTSNTDLFINAIQSSEKTSYDAFKFNVYLMFTVVVDDKPANYQIQIHKTQYYNPQKVNHLYGTMNGIDILNKKYLSRN